VGGASLNVEGRVIMYGDTVTRSMRAAIDETNRRRGIQQRYNEENGIEPHSVVKEVRELINLGAKDEKTDKKGKKQQRSVPKKLSPKQKAALIEQLTEEMKFAAGSLEFERAAEIRDRIRAIQEE